MLSSDSGPPCQLPLQSPQSSNENNRGIIGNGSNNLVNSGNIINSDIVIEINDSEDELERLLSRHVSKDALRNSFYSPPECHPNTRTTVRNEIGEWIDESGSEKSPLLWLNGPAAVGKSVIAKTISGFHDQIVSTFFFSTSSDKSAATLFPTLAWQLAWRIPDTRKHTIASLKSGGLPQTSQIEEQFNLLIIRPLKNTTTLRSRPVMVIDGVDECIDESMLVRFLQVLVRAGKDGGMPVRFVICSRPEPRIHAILVPDDNTTHGQERRIGRRSRSECKEDIARYLTDKFNAIPQPGEGTSPWFQLSDISDLVEASCGQFLYASTIVRL
ncbi:hypothetical protein JOM56_008065, partial [Amanita muscaria]